MIFIPGNVPSSKNSKQFIRPGLIISSKITQRYIKETKKAWNNALLEFKEMIKEKERPLLVGFHFIRDSRRRWDFINACQLPCDLMVKYGFLEDDCTSIMIPIPLKIGGEYYSYNKENPGVIIEIQ